ncbi:MAG: YggT family protein [Anaerolineae bacterium]|jgi:YggT family protein|nr:YggT family protein [Anaerolineae bacterium]
MTLALVSLINTVIEIFSILILVEVIASWVMIANVRLPDIVVRALQVISQITSVVLNPIRRVVPSIGGLDLSPIIALILLDVLRRLLISLVARM